MKKTALLFVCILLFHQAWAQGEKGASGSAETNEENQPNNYWALIIGISEYERIKPLEYADKDAMFFLEYLKSTLGEKLPDDHVQILLNKKATGPAFETSLRWLSNNAKEGDAVFIYYSGHGGTEDYTISKRGYLLGYDSHQDAYSEGNLTLLRLEDYLNTFASKDIISYVILDACHSGKSQTEYMGDLNTELSRNGNFSDNIIKILSASGEELSYENKKWGGGHGVFTYYLVKGLSGEADNSPTDSLVTVKELRRFLEDYVPAETDDQQNPRIVYDQIRYPLGVSNNQFLTTIEDVGVEFDYTYGLLASRDPGAIYSEEELNQIDSIIQKLEKYEFFNSQGTGAVAVIENIIESSSNEALKSRIIDELYIASMEYSHQYINFFLDDSHSRDSLNFDYSVGYKLMDEIGMYYPDSFETAQIESKKMFFKGIKSHWDYHDADLTVNDILDVAQELEIATEYDSEAAYLYYLQAVLYYHADEYEKAIDVSQTSMQYAPNWSSPLTNLGNIYAAMGDDYFNIAIETYLKADSLSENNVTALRNIGSMYYGKYYDTFEVEYYDLAEKYLLMAIDKQPYAYEPWEYLWSYGFEMDSLVQFAENKITEYSSMGLRSNAADMCEILADYYLYGIEGKPNQAKGIEYYEKAILIEEEDMKWYYRYELATIYRDMVRLNDGLSNKEVNYISQAAKQYNESYSQTLDIEDKINYGGVIDLYLLDYAYHEHPYLIKYYSSEFNYNWDPAIENYKSLFSRQDLTNEQINDILLPLMLILKYGLNSNEYGNYSKTLSTIFQSKVNDSKLSEGELASWLTSKGIYEMSINEDYSSAVKDFERAYYLDESDPNGYLIFYIEALILNQELEKANEVNELMAYDVHYDSYSESGTIINQYYNLYSAMIEQEDPNLIRDYIESAIWDGYSDIPYLKYHPAFANHQDIVEEVLKKNKKYLKY